MNPSAENVKPIFERAKILVVDDAYCTRKVIHALLLAMGCTRIYEASNGASGLEAVRAIDPDLILLDWAMPGMDGAEFVRRMRSPKGSPQPNVPVVMLTSHGERSRVLEAVGLGVHEFLLKPVSSAALEARMLSVLSKPRSMARRGDDFESEPRLLAS